MGALIGSFYACGYSVDEMINLEKNINILSFLGISALKEGSLVSGKKVEEALQKIVGNKRLEKTKIRMYVQATDLLKRKPVIFSKGKISRLLAASSAFPFLISPSKIKNRWYLDGDISSSYAASFLREKGADIVIGLYPGQLRLINRNLLTKFRLPMAALYGQLLEMDLMVNPVDVLIRDYGIEMDFLDFTKIDELVADGYQAAMKQMPRIKVLLKE